MKVLGQGAFGKVFLVRHRTTQKVYAMKRLRKDNILQKGKVQATLLEKQVLQEIDHPFTVGLEYCFHTEFKIYFVLPFVRGGELFQHLAEATNFPEDRSKRIALQLALAIGHLHSKKIVYRDLKPENVLVGEDGYMYLIDFGISKKLASEEVTRSFCGTPEYLAPEMLKRAGHSYTLDWWTLGVLTYELMVGFPPFFAGQDQDGQMKKLTKMILENEVFFPNEQQHNIAMSDDCKDFIAGCLRKDPK